MANRSTLLRFVINDIQKATNEITAQGGAVTIRLSNVVFVASMPANFNPTVLKESTATERNDLDAQSLAMLNHWRAVEQSDLLTLHNQPNRRLNLDRRGLAAVALVMETDIVESTVPRILAGAHILGREFAAATVAVANRLTLLFQPYTVSPGGDIPGGRPPTVPPQLDAPPAAMVPQSLLSSWPSAVAFRNLLYCFYRGHGAQNRSLFYSARDSSSSWPIFGAQVPDVVTSDAGPSALVYNDKLYCFTPGSASLLDIWYTAFDGTSWERTQQVPNTRMKGGPSVVAFNSSMYCFHQGWMNPSNALWYNVYNGQSWEGDRIVSGSSITGSPSAVVFNNLIYCFYQGAGTTANVLMVRVLTLQTGMWSEERPVPNSTRMSQSPSAVVLGGILYCFHQAELEGKCYANVTADGVEWGENTLIDDASLCEGLGAGVFNNELYYIHQRGSGGKVTNGEMWYRKLLLPSDAGERYRNADWVRSQGEPSLEELGFEPGYRGFIQLAVKMQTENNAKFGYVVYVRRSSLLFDAYADETRMCLQYKEPGSSLHVSFAKMFSAEGTFDQRLVNDSQFYPPRPVLHDAPRYTFAWSRDWKDVLSNATLILVYRAWHAASTLHMWVLFWDKRNLRWVEMEGPRISPRTNVTWGGALGPQFGPDSRLFVFYHTETNQEMRYNILGVRNQAGERIWDVEKVMHGNSASNTPSPLAVGQNMHVFYLGSITNNELRYTSLDTEVNHWTQTRLAYQMGGATAPSAVHFLGRIYAFHKGGAGHNPNKLAFSIWDKNTLEWNRGQNNAASTHDIFGDLAAVVVGGFVYVFYTSPATTVWWNRFNGVNWKGPEVVPMAYRDVKPNQQGAIAACAWGEKIHCFFRNLTPAPATNTLLIYKVFNTLDFSWENEVVLPTAVGLFNKPGPILNQLLFGS